MKKKIKIKNFSGFSFILKKKFILIFFFNKLFLKHFYVKSKVYTFFFSCFLLYKFGFFNLLFKYKNSE